MSGVCGTTKEWPSFVVPREAVECVFLAFLSSSWAGAAVSVESGVPAPLEVSSLLIMVAVESLVAAASRDRSSCWAVIGEGSLIAVAAGERRGAWLTLRGHVRV